MAELLGVGLTHYPPLLGLDEDMSWVLRWTLEDPDIPDSAKAVTAWPERMRAEWGDDDGVAAAAAHRAQLMAGFDRVHRAIDGFEPDVVVVFGDDQYENFREDLIPPLAVLAYEDMDVRRGIRICSQRCLQNKVCTILNSNTMHAASVLS